MTTNVPPPHGMRTTKGEPPPRPAEATAGSRNLAKPQPGGTVGLNFKVGAEFRRDFKIEAAMHGLNQVALLQQMFALWKQQKG
jgi:hypothetical protein